MMVHEILWGMYGAADGRRQKIRQGKNFEKNFRVLKEIVKRLNRDGPFIGRIITLSKYFAGRLEKLKLNGEELKFRVKGCHPNGSSNGADSVFEEEAELREVADIQIVADKNGRPISWFSFTQDLFNSDGDLK